MNKHTLISIVLLLVLLMPIIIPPLQPGFFLSDDGDWMIIRLSAFHETLKTGQFPVRFLERLNHGYGYPVTNFLYPLPFYLGEPIHLMGFGFMDSIKILFAGSFVVGASGMYIWLEKKWGNLAGLVGAIFYSYIPYHLFDIYTRGSLGEAVALAVIPLSFLSLDKLLAQSSPSSLALLSFSVGALVTSHNSLAVISLPIIGLYGFFKSYKDRKLILKLAFGFFLGIAMATFFWLPAIHDLQFTRSSLVQVASFRNYFLSLANFGSVWSIVELLILAISINLIMFGLLVRKNIEFEIKFFSLVGVAALLLTLPISTALWQLPILPKFVQFPWRFLSLVTLSVAVLAASLSRKSAVLTFLLTILLLVFSVANLRLTRTFHPESFYTTNDDSTTVKNEYLPIWVKNAPTVAPKTKIEWFSQNVVQFNTVYFPGWTAYVNGEKKDILISENGLIRVGMLPGDEIVLRFEETPIRQLANIISLLAITISLGLLIYPHLPRKTHDR